MKLPSSPGTLRAALLGSLAILSFAAGSAEAAVQTFRYFQFKPTKLRSSTALIQLSEMQFFNGATAIPTAGVVVTDPGNNSPVSGAENPPNAFDGILTNKWLNYTFGTSALIFDFGTPTAIDSYNYVTGGDANDRDPVSWTIQGSTDGVEWVLLDSRADQIPTAARNAVAYTTKFVIPASPPPTITEFDFFINGQPIIVKNGSMVPLYAETALATSSIISSNTSSTTYAVPSGGGEVDVTPPDNSDTTYTLKAISSGGTVSQSLFVRTVSGAPLTYRYVRYVPTKQRSGNQIQLCDFSFSSNGTKVPVATVTNPGGQDQPGEGIAALIDDESTSGPTKWFSGTIAPVIFDFGSPTTFDSYTFETGGDAPERDPVQWYMEGSNDETTWDLIENMTTIVYPTTTLRTTTSDSIPFPGPANTKPIISLASDVSTLLAGESAVLTYSSVGAQSVSISPATAVTGTSGTVTVTPSATTTYTLTAVKTGAPTVTSTATATVNVTVPSGIINFPNFEDATQISTVGSAHVLNDFGTFYAAPNAKRLRLTDMANGQAGSAWAISKIKLSDGFETTFDASIANTMYYNGADGMAFTIQNSPQRYAAHPDSELQFNSNALTIALDSYPDHAADNETNANLEVYNGLTRIADVNLSKTDGTNPTSLALGYQGNYLVTGVGIAPYKIKVTYTPGSLSISFNGTPVVTNLAVDLSAIGAVDADGKAWVGFSGRTGGLSEFHDVVDWVLTPTASTTTPLAITASAFTLGASPSVALTFTSIPGKTYKVTQSTDLVTWTQIGSNVAAGTGATTSTTAAFASGTKGFFRVELVP